MRLDLQRIAKALDDRGVGVRWNPEGTHRGAELPSLKAIVLHDTVTTRAWKEEAVWKLLTHGRTDPPLKGPLCQLSPDRAGVIWLIANGLANHNGFGDFGNGTVGVEVQCAGGLKGHEEPWNAIQRTNTVILCQVLENIYGDLPIVGHRENDDRKIDPFGVDMSVIRHQIASPVQEDDNMDIRDFTLAPNEQRFIPIEPAEKGFFGNTKTLLLLECWPGQSTKVQVFSSKQGGGEVTVTGERSVRELAGGTLHLHNRGGAPVHGAILVRKT